MRMGVAGNSQWEWVAGNSSSLFVRGILILTENKKLWNKRIRNCRIAGVSRQVRALFFFGGGGGRHAGLKPSKSFDVGCHLFLYTKWPQHVDDVLNSGGPAHLQSSLGTAPSSEAGQPCAVPLGVLSMGKVKSLHLWRLPGFERGMFSSSLYFYSLLFLLLQGLSTLYCLLKWVLMESSLLFLNSWFFLLVPYYFNSAGLFFMSFACWPLIYSLAFLFLISFFSIPIIFYFSLSLFFELAWIGAN